MDSLDDFIAVLLDRCRSLGIQVKFVDLNPRTPPASNPKNKTIVMNCNWYDQRQLPLQLLHEMKHIEHQDDQFAILYFDTGLKRDFERDANMEAVEDLADMYLDNVRCNDDIAHANYRDFESLFGIPCALMSTVKTEFINYGEEHNLDIY
ncbi:hypothetical protein [Furfurilactobacillus entadae]|uniref:hypothetical protein n=1 Tax=Furfurilactobacillus entadae TaxID=2922307 RepID=UPI0035E80C6E